MSKYKALKEYIEKCDRDDFVEIDGLSYPHDRKHKECQQITDEINSLLKEWKEKQDMIESLNKEIIELKVIRQNYIDEAIRRKESKKSNL